ncbi:MAG: hypothetical protein J3K34DRAFT_464443 [Monoraphidium minutum]|nr:MAG: hypothetical protein J3K34DRAFT_464443 [Monoraphidium minutum]
MFAARGPHPASSSNVSRVPTWRVSATKQPKAPAKSSPLNDPRQRAQDLMFSGAVSQGTITGYNRGGLLVELDGEDLKGFMPYTKISPDRLEPGHKGDLKYLVGQKIKTCVVQVDTQSAREELVLSERQARAAEALGALSEGQVVKGEVVRLEDYGAIVALLGPDGGQLGLQGLVHKKELSWDVVMTVEDVLSMGQVVDMKVIGVDKARRNVSLSLRAMQKDPLTETIESLEWRTTTEVPAEIIRIVAVLMSTSGISDVRPGRQAEEHSTVSQDLELYLTKNDLPGGFTLVARSGRLLQELIIETELPRDAMKKALTRVLSRVR